MTNLKYNTIEKVGIDFVRFVNENYDELQHQYQYHKLEEARINFPTWCMVQYGEQYNQATISSDELTQTV